MNGRIYMNICSSHIYMDLFIREEQTKKRQENIETMENCQHLHAK